MVVGLLEVEKVSFLRRRRHPSSSISLPLTDEQNQERPEARIERRLNRDDLRNDQSRIPLRPAPPHVETRKARRKEQEENERAIDACLLDDGLTC